MGHGRTLQKVSHSLGKQKKAKASNNSEAAASAPKAGGKPFEEAPVPEDNLVTAKAKGCKCNKRNKGDKNGKSKDDSEVAELEASMEKVFLDGSTQASGGASKTSAASSAEDSTEPDEMDGDYVDGPGSLSAGLSSAIRKDDMDGAKRVLNEIMAAVTKCEKTFDTGLICDATIGQLKRACNMEGIRGDVKAHAIFTLSVVVMSTCRTRATMDRLANYLLEIVESDGYTVDAMDDAEVISTSLFAWCFVVTFMLDSIKEAAAPEGADEFLNHHRHLIRSYDYFGNATLKQDESYESTATGEERQDYLVSDGHRALEVFVDQLRSENVQVQTAACQGVGLIFEARHKYDTCTSTLMRLQTTREDLARKVKAFYGGLDATAARGDEPMDEKDLCSLKDAFFSLYNALEKNTGPTYRSSTGMCPTDFDMCHKIVSVSGSIVTLDKWRMSIQHDAASKVTVASGDKSIDVGKCLDLWGMTSSY